MIIVLKPNTSDKDIARVEHQIKRNGLDTHIVRGQEMTIIGCSFVVSTLLSLDSLALGNAMPVPLHGRQASDNDLPSAESHGHTQAE